MKRIIAIGVFILISASPAFAECSAADKRALEMYDRAWGESSRIGDRAALEQIYASDYMNLSAGTPQNKAEAIDSTVRDAAKAKLTADQPQVTYDYYMINCTPTTATISHRNTVVTMRDGKPETSYSRSVHVVEKRNGKWQVVSNAGHPLSNASMLLYMERDWANADVTGDAAWLESHLADDYSGISSRTGKLFTKSEEVADMRNRKSTVTAADNLNTNVRMLGDDAAVVTGTYRLQGREQDGKPFDRTLAYTDVWVKRDGRWQVLASQGTPVAN
jgi:ketosteroid isomerase-like protein